MTTSRATKLPHEATKITISEAAFQRQVVQLAKYAGWHVHHSRTVRLANGRHATPLQGHKGLPDLILAKRGCILFIELKADNRTRSPEQTAWAAAIVGAQAPVRGEPVTVGRHTYLLAQPRDFDTIAALLTAK